MKAAIYARFSSTLQDARSVDDQVRICRERCAREGWAVIEVFADRAISGAVRDRPGLNAMLERAGEFDVVVSEAIDRVSRHQGDIATIYETLKFNSCRLVTLSEGDVSEIHIGFTGTMAALFRTNLADKVRRGQKGRVAAGRVPSICYGYRKVARLNAAGEAERGLREIDDEQAAIVLRVFSEAAAGQSARQIVSRLNAERVASPSGSKWQISYINGHADRGGGLLHNEMYVGHIVWNRTRMVRDPATRRRVVRVNPKEEWVRCEAPELRIVPQDLWDKVQAQREANADVPIHRLRRPKRLLSGLVTCGLCGGNYVITGSNGTVWGCGTRRNKATCTNNRLITNSQLEARVLEGLKTRLLDPEVVRLAIVRVHKYVSETSKQQAAARARLERKLADVAAKVDRLVTAFANGGREFDEIREVLAGAKAERGDLERQLANIEAEKVIPFLPNVADEYRRSVERLSESLSGAPDARIDAVPALRSLIDSIVLLPKPSGRGVDIELVGRLANMIAMASGKALDVEPVRAVANGGRMYDNGASGSLLAPLSYITRIMV